MWVHDEWFIGWVGAQCHTAQGDGEGRRAGAGTEEKGMGVAHLWALKTGGHGMLGGP